jgi:hypothetical protein
MDAKPSPVNLGPLYFVFWCIFKGWIAFNKIIFENKNAIMAGRWKLTFIFPYGGNSWTVELRQIKFDTVKDHGHTYIRFRTIWIIILFDEASKYGYGVKFWGYVVTNTEPLRVEFSNFVQFHTFVNYFMCYYYNSCNFFFAIGMITS